MESAKMIELETTADSLYDGGWRAADREELKGVKTMMFVVRSETTEALCCSDKFDTLEDAREQMALWVEVDDDGESQDWADYILAVPDKDVEDAVYGHADTEKFVEGKCGNEYHGSHYWEM